MFWEHPLFWSVFGGVIASGIILAVKYWWDNQVAPENEKDSIKALLEVIRRVLYPFHSQYEIDNALTVLRGKIQFKSEHIPIEQRADLLDAVTALEADLRKGLPADTQVNYIIGILNKKYSKSKFR